LNDSVSNTALAHS